MYDFAAEDFLFLHTWGKIFYLGVLEKHSESEDVPPHELSLQKIAF